MQGSGKDTQSEFICSDNGLYHLSTGNIIRDHIKKGTDLGKLCLPYTSKGDFVPDPIIMDLVEEKLSEYGNNFLLDGIPRNESQANRLQEITSLDKVISINIPLDIALQRLSGRYSSNDKTYNTNSDEDKLNISYDNSGNIKQVFLKNTGEELSQRDDDTPKGIERRIKLFNSETKPLIDFYRPILIEVDGTLKPGEVYTQIKEKLQDKSIAKKQISTYER